MENSISTVDLGFAQAKIPQGTHICQVYSDDDERNDSLLQFLLSGVRRKELSACFSDNITEEKIDSYVKTHGHSLESAKADEAFALSRASDVYFQGGTFEPERMLDSLRSFHQKSIAGGFPAARVIGEMTPDIEKVPGGTILMEFEYRGSLLLEDHPMIAVCQYCAHDFDGATIMDVLKVHPMMVVRGAVVYNPFFVPPREYLASV